MARTNRHTSGVLYRAVADAAHLLLVDYKLVTDNPGGNGQQAKHASPTWPGSAAPSYMLKEQHPAPTGGAMLTAAPFTVAKKCKHSTCLSRQVTKRQGMYTMECYSDVKKDIFRWMDWTQKQWGSPDPGRQTSHVLPCFLLCEAPTSTCSDVTTNPAHLKKPEKLETIAGLGDNIGGNSRLQVIWPRVGKLGNWGEG